MNFIGREYQAKINTPDSFKEELPNHVCREVSKLSFASCSICQKTNRKTKAASRHNRSFKELCKVLTE